jgi:glycosyltransferase involved in cell wall biosynthesis
MNQQPAEPRRLLLVTYYFPPSAAVAAYRMLGFARHLPAFGWQVGVVAPPSVPYEPVDETLTKRVPPDTAYFTAPYPSSLPARIARRFIHHGIWLPRALATAVRAINEFKPDAVLTSGPPHCVHLLGLFLKRFYQLPWAACLRDPWVTTGPPIRGFGIRRGWARICEQRVFQAADCVIANTPQGYDGLRKAFPHLENKLTFVTNGFDPDFFPPPRPIGTPQDRLTILHAGELYLGRDPRPLLDAIKALGDSRALSQPSIRLRILGQSTDPRVDLVNAIRDRGLESIVELGGQVPYSEALDAMTKADVLLLLDTPGRRIGIPAKLFEYLGAARPILALTEPDGDVAWVLRTSGAPHRIASPREPDQIRQAILELRDGLRHARLALPPPNQQACFTRAKLAGQLADHLDRLILKKQPMVSEQQPASPGASTNHALERIHSAATASRSHYTRT